MFPPPYPLVSFVTPYTPTAPLGGNPVVSIIEQTGLIVGTPTNLGLFTVGVCVQEYRNGVLLSTSKRDFQFTVINCITLDAEIEADIKVDDNHFIYNKCDGNILTMVNESF